MAWEEGEAETVASRVVPHARWHPRTRVAAQLVAEALERPVVGAKRRAEPSVAFDDVANGMSRREAAALFFELLVLRSWDVVETTDELRIGKTPRFDEAVAEARALVA